MNGYSVLMSVYYKEKPEYLKEAMNSIWEQTLPTNDFVLVCDGPLTDALDVVIKEMQLTHSGILQVIRLEKNVGLGNALNEGIKCCKNELVARMDSDDISRPDRCEKQVAVFMTKPEISLCSGIVEEFTDDREKIEVKRVIPETHAEILEFAKKRNPFNHPCIMYKKNDVIAAGDYQDFYLLEDYYLWVRMLLKGFQGYNIQEPLLWMRAGNELYKRRAGWMYAKSQHALFKYMKDNRFIDSRQYTCSLALRVGASLSPNWLRKIMYRLCVRNK